MLAIGHVRDAAPSFWTHGLDSRTLPETWAGKEVNPSRASFTCWLKEKPLSAPADECDDVSCLPVPHTCITAHGNMLVSVHCKALVPYLHASTEDRSWRLLTLVRLW